MAHNTSNNGGEKVGAAAVPKFEKLFYSVLEACHLTGLSRATLYHAMANKRLVYFKVGARTLIPGDALVRFVQGE